MSIILPSSGTFLVRCYSRRRILARVCSKTGFQLSDENTPLNVELRPCIESHFKCTIMNVKIIFRLGFGVKLHNLPGPRCNQLTWFFARQRRKCTTTFEISWMHRSAWLESNIKGTIWSGGSLSGTIILQFAVVRQVRIRGHPPEPLLSYAQRAASWIQYFEYIEQIQWRWCIVFRCCALLLWGLLRTLRCYTHKVVPMASRFDNGADEVLYPIFDIFHGFMISVPQIDSNNCVSDRLLVDYPFTSLDGDLTGDRAAIFTRKESLTMRGYSKDWMP